MEYCGCSKLKKKKKAILSFKRSELLYDIQNYAFVEGDITPTDNIHVQHQIFDIGEEGNIDRVTRILNLAYSECVEMLYPYSQKIIPDTQEPLNDILTEPEVYNITLVLPEEFSQTTLDILRHLIHEYLISKVLADWMGIINNNNRSYWEYKINELRLKIQSSVVARRGKITRKLQPF